MVFAPNIRDDIAAEYLTDLAALMDKWQTFITPVFVLGGRLITVGEDGEALIIEDGAAVSILFPHYKIHEGDMFEVSYATVAETDGNIADNAFIDFAITTPNVPADQWHLIYEAGFGGDFETALYEGATWNVGTGVAMVEYNRNRQSGNAAQVTVERNPAGVVLGAVMLENRVFPGGSGGAAQGNVGGSRDEWILAVNQTYILRAINRAGNAQPASMRIMWYRE